MNWKEQTLEAIKKQAKVEPVSCHENRYIVSMNRGNEVLRTMISLDVEHQSVTYENNMPHIVDTGTDLLESMYEHLSAAEMA